MAGIIRTILSYPEGAVVGLREDEFTTEYRTVSGYLYERGSFYVLFSGSMVNMERLDELAVSIKKKKEGKRCRRARK